MSIQYSVDLKAPARPYPHYWEFCVGSCHAATLLRKDVQDHIRKAHNEIGFRYIRFHGLFDNDMSVYFKPSFGFGEPIISFYNIDVIFDFLLEIGMKPFIEIGFMPDDLAASDAVLFHYKGRPCMPNDDEEWKKLIRLFGEHLIERYGLDEVRQWFFEVWNEPNLRFFFDGTQEDYFHLYEMTARTLKAVEPTLQVGGPATSVNAWIVPFKKFCADNDVPVDFISTHHYPSDDPLSTMGMNGPGTKGAGFDLPNIDEMTDEEKEAMRKAFMNRVNKNPRDILVQMTRKAKAEADPLPLYYTEWHGSGDYDTSYQAAFDVQTFAYNEGLVKGYSYWTVSDIFEEMGMKPGPFKNEFGLQTNHGVAKPSYRAFQALHEAGSLRIDVPSQDPYCEVLALTDGQDEATVFVYNHDLDRRTKDAKEVELKLCGAKQVWKAVIDDDHTNPKKAWEEMGCPAYLTKEQELALHRASELKYEQLAATGEDTYTFVAEPESVTIFKVRI